MKSKKFNAAIIGASCSVLLLWALEAFGSVTAPNDVGAALGAILTYAASFIIPDDVEE